MESDWGYYCHSCQRRSTRRYFADPRVARRVYLRSCRLALQTTQVIHAPATEFSAILFLLAHAGHDLWAENDGGWLHLEPPIALREALGSSPALSRRHRWQAEA